MPEAGVQHSTVSYSSLFNACAKAAADESSRAEVWLERMSAARVEVRFL